MKKKEVFKSFYKNAKLKTAETNGGELGPILQNFLPPYFMSGLTNMLECFSLASLPSLV